MGFFPGLAVGPRLTLALSELHILWSAVGLAVLALYAISHSMSCEDVIEPDGAAISWLEAYRNGVLAGVGSAGTTSYSVGEDAAAASPMWQRLLMSTRLIGRSYAVSPGFVGMTRGSDPALASPVWMCVLPDGRRALLKAE